MSTGLIVLGQKLPIININFDEVENYLTDNLIQIIAKTQN